jgi:hypothetical protein
MHAISQRFPGLYLSCPCGDAVGSYRQPRRCRRHWHYHRRLRVSALRSTR